MAQYYKDSQEKDVDVMMPTLKWLGFVVSKTETLILRTFLARRTLNTLTEWGHWFCSEYFNLLGNGATAELRSHQARMFSHILSPSIYNGAVMLVVLTLVPTANTLTMLF